MRLVNIYIFLKSSPGKKNFQGNWFGQVNFSRISSQKYVEFYDGLNEPDSVHVSCTDFKSFLELRKRLPLGHFKHLQWHFTYMNDGTFILL